MSSNIYEKQGKLTPCFFGYDEKSVKLPHFPRFSEKFYHILLWERKKKNMERKGGIHNEPIHNRLHLQKLQRDVLNGLYVLRKD